MPRKKKAETVTAVDSLKTTVYNQAKEHSELVQCLNEENLALGLNPRDRRSDKAGKTLSDLYVTLGRAWQVNQVVRQVVRDLWGMGKKPLGSLPLDEKMVGKGSNRGK